MRYVLTILLNQDKSKVLLQLKDRSIYAGKYNVPGGKMQKSDENSLRTCCLRELKEETGLTPEQLANFKWLGTLTLPYGCTDGHINETSDLGFFAAIVDEDLPKQQPGETEPLRWHPVNQIHTLRQQNKLAGTGELEYFIATALREI